MAGARWKTAKWFPVVIAIAVGVTRYEMEKFKRVNVNDQVGVWDTKAKNGTRFTVVERAWQTKGKYFRIHAYIGADAPGFYDDKPGSPPRHFHHIQDEHFEVTRGTLMVELNGAVQAVEAGSSINIPKGTAHTVWSGNGQPVEAVATFTPGVPDEGFLEAMVALGYQFDGLAKVNPIQIFLLFADNRITLTDIPTPVWYLCKIFLEPLANAMGFKSRYAAYRHKAGQPLPVELEAQAEPAAAEAAAKEEPAAVEAKEEAAGEARELGEVAAEAVAAEAEAVVAEEAAPAAAVETEPAAEEAAPEGAGSGSCGEESCSLD
ncbi:hypothetical protein HYH03_011554 [Edaphochlamys debaryana]|uniref:Cupin type-2 domain-containing protein n=1 Tax=Edaphochlamys debaryana TaxID=47281 RepID=A0A835XRM9_9CHLO|nr:hypothetical protein HYH03_011554 [Edaphochlamys debaryana]|eukprot:KAG2489917.1 hypothetical protein HYH03_011554 [Edaphochlamys debaryana]